MEVQNTLDRAGLLPMTIVYLLISVAASALAQILLKKGMVALGPLTLSLDRLGNIVWRLATDPYVIAGLIIYAAGTVFWLLALSRADLSYAYAFAALQYVILLAASWWLFQEAITLPRLVGTLVITVGVLLVSWS